MPTPLLRLITTFLLITFISSTATPSPEPPEPPLFSLELTNNGQPLPLLTFSGTSDLPFLATEFVQTHDIRDAHSVSCADQPCTIAALINSMERLLAPSRPPLPFPPAYPSLPPPSPPLDPLDIPRSVCELLTWAGTDRPPILAAERDLFCSTKYRLPSHLCENLLSDLCQLSLAALDPDEQIPVDIKLLSESPTSIISEKRRKLFNDSDVLEVHLKRKEINDWQDRVFGRVLCMVPARAGSERLRLKNMRLIGGKPMVEHAIQKALESGVCDRVVVNSDNDMFRPLAVRNGAEFYLRPLALGSSTTKADDVVYDFMLNHPGDLLVWVNPTSPLQPVSEIRQIVSHLLSNPSIDSLVAVREFQRHAVKFGGDGGGGAPINFDPAGKGDKTQELDSVGVGVYSILAWQYKPFKRSFEEHGSAYFNGLVKYYPVSALSAVVVKYEEDADFANSILGFDSEREYDALADSFLADDEVSPPPSPAPLPSPPPPPVFVLATYAGDGSHPFLLANVRRIFAMHPGASVHVVDNGSANKDHILQLRAASFPGSLHVHEFEASGYELGACSWVWRSFKERYAGGEHWICMQDNVELQKALPLHVLGQQPFLPFWYFTYPLMKLNEPVFDADSMQQFVVETLAKLGMEGQEVRSAVFTNSFAATRSGMQQLEDVGLWDVVVDEKVKSQGCERLLGGVLANLGWEPYTYALSSMNIMISRGRADRGGSGGGGNEWVRKLYPGDVARFAVDAEVSANVG